MGEHIIEVHGDSWDGPSNERKAIAEARRSIKEEEWSAIRVTDSSEYPMRYVWGAWWVGPRLVTTTDLEDLHQMTDEHDLLDYANWEEDD